MNTGSMKSESSIALEARELQVIGGKKVLLDGFDLVLRRGEVHALIGKNGTGKSTLLKVLAGMRVPGSGIVEAHGSRIGALIEEPSFFPELTGLANAEYLACVLGVADPKKEARRVLELVGLKGEICEEIVGDYSKGQRQRLGIGLALIGDPAVLLLDEPFNFIDVSGVCSMKAAFRQIALRRGTAILIASHVCDHVVGLADQFSFIADGGSVFHESAQEIERLCERYVLLETADPERALAVMERSDEKYDAVLDNSGGIRIRAKTVPAKLLQELDAAGVVVGEVRPYGESYEELFCRLSDSGR